MLSWVKKILDIFWNDDDDGNNKSTLYTWWVLINNLYNKMKFFCEQMLCNSCQSLVNHTWNKNSETTIKILTLYCKDVLPKNMLGNDFNECSKHEQQCLLHVWIFNLVRHLRNMSWSIAFLLLLLWIFKSTVLQNADQTTKIHMGGGGGGWLHTDSPWSNRALSFVQRLGLGDTFLLWKKKWPVLIFSPARQWPK